MNWDDKRDFEVNKTLSILLGQYKPIEVSNLVVDVVGDVEHHRQYGGPMHATHHDYCDSWENMGPLIEDHRISINWWGEHWSADIQNMVKHRGESNPLRAAAICLIKKLEAENAKV